MRRFVCHVGSLFSQKIRHLPTVLIWGVLVGVVSTAMPVPSRAADTPAAFCWVEFKFSSPIHKLKRYGVSFPSFYNFDRYAVLTNPSVPDYKFGQTDEKTLWYQFLATCEDSKEAIAILAGDSMKRRGPPKVTSMTARPSNSGDLRRVKYYLEWPKYWQRDCIVAIDTVATQRNHPVIGKKFLDYLREYISLRREDFAPNDWNTNYGHSRLYIKFAHSCDRRVEMAKKFLAAYRQKFDDGHKYQVLEKKIDPNSLKIHTSSPVWLDHYFPDGPPRK